MKIIKILLSVSLLATAVISFLLGAYLWQVGSSLPDYKHLADYAPPVTTRAHAGDGELIAEFAKQRRLFVPIDVVPKVLENAFLAAEDKNFYNHFGLDFFGIMRAVVQNVLNVVYGRRLEGASTITQQVAKNFLLTNDVTFQRKIKEAILAVRLENAFDKRQILELYLNEIYLGIGSYGVAAAALNYFDKSLAELTLAEAAYLAALPKAPNNYHPIRGFERAIGRRNWVLERMVDEGFVTRAEAAIAQASALEVNFRSVGSQSVEASHFVESIRRQVYDLYGDKQLYGGGLSIRSTLNTQLQAIGVQALRDGLVSYDQRQGYRGPVVQFEQLTDWPNQLSEIKPPADIAPWRLAVVLSVDDNAVEIGLRPEGVLTPDFVPELGRIPLSELRWGRRAASSPSGSLGAQIITAHQVLGAGDVIYVEPKGSEFALRQIPEVNGALVAMDPHTGRVMAMVGGFSYSLSEFNRATQARRQPGSAFKPIVYARALDDGYTPASLVLDAPFVIDQGRDQGLWKPENFARRFYGLSTLRLGMEQSRNLMTIRLAQQIGMRKVVDYARAFGVNESMPPVLAMALGAGETTLLKMVNAYSIFVNGGKSVSPVMIDRIQDRYGKTIFKNDQRVCSACIVRTWDNQTPPSLPDLRKQVLPSQTAYQIVSMLEGVVQRGTGRSIRSLNRPLAGKTGTTNDSRDAWFLGFSPDLVVGVYIGFDDNRSLGRRETGGLVAAPVFKEFMRLALRDEPIIPFRIPPAVNLVRINAKTGKLAQKGDKNVILEAFKVGTEPIRGRRQLVIDGNAPAANKGDQAETGADIGGLY